MRYLQPGIAAVLAVAALVVFFDRRDASNASHGRLETVAWNDCGRLSQTTRSDTPRGGGSTARDNPLAINSFTLAFG